MNHPRVLFPFCPKCGADLFAPRGPRLVTHRYRLDLILLAFAFGLAVGLGLHQLGPK